MPERRFVRWRSAVTLVIVLGCCCAASDSAAKQPKVARTIWKGTVGDFSIRWTNQNIVVTGAKTPGTPVLSFKAMAESGWEKLKQEAPDQAMQSERTYRILSAVGPFLSVEEEADCDCGGAHPSSSKRFRAYDLRKSAPEHPAFASLTDIFPEEAVFTALRGDKLVAGALKDVEGPPPASLSELLQAIQAKSVQVGECSYYFGGDLLTDFAFYSTEATAVSVRISLSHAAEVCRGQMTQIGIRLPIPAAIKAELDAANSGKSGLLMKQAQRMSAGAATGFTFSTKNYGK